MSHRYRIIKRGRILSEYEVQWYVLGNWSYETVFLTKWRAKRYIRRQISPPYVKVVWESDEDR